MDRDLAFGGIRPQDEHCRIIAEVLGACKNELLLSPIRNSFSTRPDVRAVSCRSLGYNQDSFRKSAGPVGLRLQRL
jgi:hypothetical protein